MLSLFFVILIWIYCVLQFSIPRVRPVNLKLAAIVFEMFFFKAPSSSTICISFFKSENRSHCLMLMVLAQESDALTHERIDIFL